MAIEGFDHEPVVLDQLDEPVRPRAHGPERHALVALLRGVLWRHHREVQQPVDERRVRLAGHEVHGVVVDDVHSRDLGHVGAVRRLLLGIEHPLEGEAHGLGVEGLAVVKDHAAPELELPRRVVHEPPRLGQLGHDPVVPVAPDQRIEHADADHGPDRRKVHGRVEVLGRPRDGDAKLALRLNARVRRKNNEQESRGASRDAGLHAWLPFTAATTA